MRIDARSSSCPRPGGPVVSAGLLVATVLALVLAVGGVAAWAEAAVQPGATAAGTTRTSASVYFAPHTRVVLFSPGTGQWAVATFPQAKPGSEIYSNRQLYRVLEPGKAQAFPGLDVAKLFEASRPYDKASRRPAASDIVLLLDKAMRPAAHASLGAVRPGATIRFQGRSYTVKADRSLADTGGVLQAGPGTLQHIEITRSAMQHVIDRHTVGGAKSAGASIFSPREDIPALIREAELIVPVPEPNGYTSREFDAGRVIGTDGRSGKQTSAYRVIATQTGKLVTAYPIVR